MELPDDGAITRYLKTEEPKAAHRASLVGA
jgi:hypothetical protein